MTLPDCMMPDGAEPCVAYRQLLARMEALIADAAAMEKVVEAARGDIADAKTACGGDGLGCKTFRCYYTDPEWRYRKCGQCPMDALSSVRDALDALDATRKEQDDERG